MKDIFLSPMIKFFGFGAGVSFIYWIVYLVRQNQLKDAQIKAKEYEVEYQKLKGEIDDSSLLDVIRRNNERKRRDS